jgi:hypothetical protein
MDSEQRPEGQNVGCSDWLGEPTPRDWPEDWSHENGRYLCLCVNCETQFYGHKRRVVCKVCAQPRNAARGPQMCSPALTECPRCKNDFRRCDGAHSELTPNKD